MIAISIKDGQLRFGRFSADGKGVKLDLINQVTASSLELSSVISSLSKEIPMKGEDIFLSLGEEYIQCDIVSMESGLELSEIEQEFTDSSSEDTSEESTITKDQDNS